jgi:hypothetical protein
MGEIPRVEGVASRGAEGETPIRRGKLSGKRTVAYCILWREPLVRPPKGKARSFRVKGNLSGKRTGELWMHSKAPLFFLGRSYYGSGIGALPHGAIRGEIQFQEPNGL